MAILKKLVYFAGPLFLLVLTAIAGYAYSSIRALSLPIPEALGLLTVFLPVVSGISTHGASRLILKSKHKKTPQLTIPILTILSLQLIYETIIVTLALTRLLPTPTLTCGLVTKWQELFSAKNGEAIKAIQDHFNCCGKNSVLDQAWPFPEDKKSPCAKMFDRTRSCLAPWRQAEQINAGLILLVALAVFITKVMSLISLFTNSSWAHPKWATGHIEEEEEEEPEDNGATMRHLIEQGGRSDEYNDQPDNQARNQATEPEDSQDPRMVSEPLIGNGNEWGR